MPCPVLGDGNCLFRAVSKAIYGHQEEHFLLRLFPTLEILKHRNLYDPKPLIFMIISKISMLSVLALALIFSTKYLLLEHLLVLSIFMH